jgi:hypothetical protein
MPSVRFSEGLLDSCLPGLQDVDRVSLFCPLKTYNRVLTAAAALVLPAKLADLDP